MGWFDSEADARSAFQELRAARSDDDGWAELVALGGGSRPTVVAWFGRPRAEPRLRRVPERAYHPAGRDRSHLRLLHR
ncbi:MAG: hypothetical protein M3326_06765 [Actinomycetota bacterium]|nr:hypothetical protein [Actinomycetota bacterium]